MRPTIEVDSQRRYECMTCGSRVVDPETTACDCGGELRNLSRSRDL